MAPHGWIDIHAHMDDEKFDGRRQAIIGPFLAEPGARLITVADPYSERSLRTTEEMLADHPGLQFMVGAHPHLADRYTPLVEKRIMSLLSHPRLAGIGEAGLDFHYRFAAPEIQVDVLGRQMDIAAEAGRPLLLHSREAETEILRLLDRRAFDRPVVFHCFTGSAEVAREITGRGGFLSFSGILTFKSAHELRGVCLDAPLARVFFETDSPYLAPVPFRGEANSPLRISAVYEKAAEIKGMEVGELLSRVGQNFRLLFPGA